MKKRLILAVVTIVVIGTTAGATMVKKQQDNVKLPVAESTATPSVHKELNITQDDVPTTAVSVAPTAEKTTPTPSVSATPSAPPAPVTYKWAVDMAKVGIAESDYGYVTEMVLDGNGWRTSGAKLWQGNAWSQGVGNTQESLKTMLPRVNNWVIKYYGGSWATAYNNWNTNGNF